MLQIYPQYQDLLNGFTYNGHDYIAAFVLLSLAVCFVFYRFFAPNKISANDFVAPLLVWLLLNFGIVFGLKGAGFFNYSGLFRNFYIRILYSYTKIQSDT